MKFITLGAGRYIAISDIAGFHNLDCLVPKRENPYLVQKKEEGNCINITVGKNTKPRAIVITKRGEVILTQFKAETIMAKIISAEAGNDDLQYSDEE